MWAEELVRTVRHVPHTQPESPPPAYTYICQSLLPLYCTALAHSWACPTYLLYRASLTPSLSTQLTLSHWLSSPCKDFHRTYIRTHSADHSLTLSLFVLEEGIRYILNLESTPSIDYTIWTSGGTLGRKKHTKGQWRLPNTGCPPATARWCASWTARLSSEQQNMANSKEISNATSRNRRCSPPPRTTDAVTPPNPRLRSTTDTSNGRRRSRGSPAAPASCRPP